MERSNKTEVLSFQQSGEFHYRWALRYLDEDNVPDALHHLWQAVEMNPDNVGYNLELASVLSDIQRYDESNEILLMLLQSSEVPGECFYGLGCNFWGLGDMDNAAESLEQYLAREPEGDYIEDAIIMLDNIEENRHEGMLPSADIPQAESMKDQAKEGNRLLQAGEFKQAIQKLETLSLEGDEDIAAKNDLAVAYYYDGQYEKAAGVVRSILSSRPRHLQSQCNLALFTNKSDPQAARRIIEGAAKTAGKDPFMNYRVAVVLCEMGEHEQARRAMEPIALQNPFDLRIQHYYALACYNSGLNKKAAALWEQLRRMYPDSTVVGWYGRLAAARLRGDDAPDTLSYSMQVPVDEVIRRIREIGMRLQQSDSLRELGRDAEFRRMLLWGMTLKDARLRRVMLQMLVASGGQDNERVLRRLLLNRQETNEFKQEIFLGLKAMNARQPFLAIMDGNIVQVCVHIHKTNLDSIVKGYREVVRMLHKHMDGSHAEDIDEAVTLWNSFLLSLISRGKPLRVRTPAVWAAALHCCVARRRGCILPYGDLARRYGANAGSVGRCIRRLLEQTEREKG